MAARRAAPDPRRSVPRTDAVLADPRLQDAAGTARPRRRAPRRVRPPRSGCAPGELAPAPVVDAALAALPPRATTLRPGAQRDRASCCTPTSAGPRSPRPPSRRCSPRPAPSTSSSTSPPGDAGAAGAGGTRRPARGGARGRGRPRRQQRRGRAGARHDRARAPAREVVVSRGEMVEIGDGFRLPDLIASCGARLREVGTTNRTHLRDYADAVGPDTGAVLKVHPSNFARRAASPARCPSPSSPRSGVPVVHDIGSGLLRPHPLLPDEPDAATSLRAGAAVVTCSGDKLLGGPQAGHRARPARRRRAAAAPPAGARPAAGQDDPGRARGDAARPAATRPRRPRRRPGRAARALRRDRPPRLPRHGVRGRGGAVHRAGSVAVRPRGCGSRAGPWRCRRRCAAPLRLGDPAVLARVEAGRTLVDPRALDPRRRRGTGGGRRRGLGGRGAGDPGAAGG